MFFYIFIDVIEYHKTPKNTEKVIIENKVEEHFKYINEQACILAIKAKEISNKDILIAGSLPSQSDTYVED